MIESTSGFSDRHRETMRLIRRANIIEGPNSSEPSVTHPFVPDPVKPLCRDCDKAEAYHRG